MRTTQVTGPSLVVASLVASLFGLYLYTEGFFIIREQLNETSKQPDSLTGAPVDKVILVVIDALRFDSTLYDKTARNSANYLNNLPIIAETLESQPNHTLLFRSISDPPTVTMQRIKAIVTGNLPSFIDLKNNFLATQVAKNRTQRTAINSRSSCKKRSLA